MGAFEPLQFLTVAQQLAHPPADESKLRSAVGRAYQALYLLAREKVGGKPGKKEKRETMRLLNEKDPSAKQQLGSLERLRIVADYQLLPVNPDNLSWENNWLEAQELLRHILPKLQAL